MISQPRPRIVVSRCLEFDACRHDGQRLNDAFVRRLRPFVRFQPVCPEVEIGLGTPRDPIRIVGRGEARRLLQPSTGRDLTARMRRFSGRFLGSLAPVDGFILKNRSPSCAPFDARLYPGTERAPALGRTPGLFAAAVRDRFPLLIVEDEGRLTNARIREHFLTCIFTNARFREILRSRSIRALVGFQASHKLLLMGYHQQQLRVLGRLVAGYRKGNLEEVLVRYGDGLARALRRPPRVPSLINVLQHAFGYFSRQLSGPEKKHFDHLLGQYRSGKIPFSVPVGLLRSWIARFGQGYLAGQAMFEPYPEDLTDMTDSGMSGRRKDR